MHIDAHGAHDDRSPRLTLKAGRREGLGRGVAGELVTAIDGGLIVV
jgi:hypothetical protein